MNRPPPPIQKKGAFTAAERQARRRRRLRKAKREAETVAKRERPSQAMGGRTAVACQIWKIGWRSTRHLIRLDPTRPTNSRPRSPHNRTAHSGCDVHGAKNGLAIGGDSCRVNYGSCAAQWVAEVI